VGVEEHYPEKHGHSDDGHAVSVELRAVSGQVSVADLGADVGERSDGTHARDGSVKDESLAPERELSPAASLRGVNDSEASGNTNQVTAAASTMRFFPAHAPSAMPTAPTRSHTLRTDDEGLLRRAGAGDPVAFKEIFVHHRSDVARLVYRMLSAPSDLEDVVQEVFVQVFRSLKDFRGQSKFSTWLHRVTVNVVLMHRRSARSRPILTEEAASDMVADERQPLPDEDAERHERMRAFQRLLARLADKKRVVFVLHELEGLAPAEIADIVGAPVLTVRTRLFYARRELEAMLVDEPSLSNLRATFTKRSSETVPTGRDTRGAP
jgi:RNA polymerase sigma-70 factor, ECF subfamily